MLNQAAEGEVYQLRTPCPPYRQWRETPFDIHQAFRGARAKILRIMRAWRLS